MCSLIHHTATEHVFVQSPAYAFCTALLQSLLHSPGTDRTLGLPGPRTKLLTPALKNGYFLVYPVQKQ